MSEREPRGIKLKNEDKDPKLEGTYVIEAYCTNCDWDGEVEVPKGQPVAFGEPLERLSRCEVCGCTTLVRHEYEEAAEETEDSETERARRLAREIEETISRQPRDPFPMYPWDSLPQTTWVSPPATEPTPNLPGGGTSINPYSPYRGTTSDPNIWNTTVSTAGPESTSASLSAALESARARQAEQFYNQMLGEPFTMSSSVATKSAA